MKLVRVQSAPFDPGAEMAGFVRRCTEVDAGGIASFTGLVRGEGGLAALELEHFPGMTEQVLNLLAEEAMTRWALSGLVLIHRFGRMAPGETIVFVATAGRHRTEALEACTFLIDRLKTDAPFWKKEWHADGRHKWVEPKASDDRRADRWR